MWRCKKCGSKDIKTIEEMQNKKAFGVIKVHIQDGNINKINAHITEEIKPDSGD